MSHPVSPLPPSPVSTGGVSPRLFRRGQFRLPVILLIGGLLLLWASRLPGLTVLPLHNDEGLHLTRAIAVWDGNPFWEIRDGKIINHLWMAAFYPQYAPDWTGRIASVLIAMIGAAGAYSVGQQIARRSIPAADPLAPLGAVLLWTATPYLFFYERLAFSDAAAGAGVVVALAAALRYRADGRWRSAVLTGVAFVLAALFKVTALPFALPIAAAIALPVTRRRLAALLVIGAIGAAAFAGPVLLLVLRGAGVFDIAAGWIGVGGGGGGSGFAASTTRLIALLTTFGPPVWATALVGGLIALSVRSPLGRLLVISGGLPLLLILLIAREVLPRHYVVALPLLLTLAGTGLGLALAAVPARPLRWVLTVGTMMALTIGAAAFMLTAYRDPAAPGLLPAEVYAEHVRHHSGGYGLRDAMIALPALVEPGAIVIGSLFPDACRRANFYAVGLTLHCGDAPGGERLAAALTTRDRAYVLTDTAPLIGMDVPAIGVANGWSVTRIAAYPRPGETAAAASVILWRVTR